MKVYALLTKEGDKPVTPSMVKAWEKQAGWTVNRHRRPSKKVALTPHHGRQLVDALPDHAKQLVKVGVFTYSGDDLEL